VVVFDILHHFEQMNIFFYKQKYVPQYSGVWMGTYL